MQQWLRDAPQLVLFLTSPIETDGDPCETQYVQPFNTHRNTFQLIESFGDQYGNRSFVRIAQNTTTGDLWVCFRPTMLNALGTQLASIHNGLTTVCTTHRTEHCLGNLLDICSAISSRTCDNEGLSQAHQRLLREPATNTNGRPLIDCIRNSIARSFSREVIFAGFSLGAAQAFCAAVMVSKPVHCIQIAGPRVAKRLKIGSLCRRLRSCSYIGVVGDPVSRMPFGAHDMAIAGNQQWITLPHLDDQQLDKELARVSRWRMVRFVIDVFMGLVLGLRWTLSSTALAFLDVHLKAEQALCDSE